MPRPEGNNPDIALQQLQQTSSVIPSLISVTQFLVVSQCFHKTPICYARIFHVFTTTTTTPCAWSCLLHPPIILNCCSTPQIQLCLFNTEIILKDSQSILSCSQVPIFFLIPLQSYLVLLLRNALETRRIPPLPTWRATSAWHWNNAQKLSQSLV